MHHIYGTLKAGICSLKKFGCLGHLELDVRLFWGAPVDKEELYDLFEEDYDSYCVKVGWTVQDIPSLADMLPATIKTVRIIAGVGTEEPAMLQRCLLSTDGRRKRCLFLKE